MALTEDKSLMSTSPCLQETALEDEAAAQEVQLLQRPCCGTDIVHGHVSTQAGLE